MAVAKAEEVTGIRVWHVPAAVVLFLVLGMAIIFSILGGAATSDRDRCAAQDVASVDVTAPVGVNGDPLAPDNGQALEPGGRARTVGATFYRPGDSTGSGTVGSSGANLEQQSDSYAELSNAEVKPNPFQFADANALGTLPYETPLRIRYGARSVVGYKRDIGFGQGGETLKGHRYAIDLWYRLSDRLRMTGSSLVSVEIPPRDGSGNVQGLTPVEKVVKAPPPGTQGHVTNAADGKIPQEICDEFFAASQGAALASYSIVTPGSQSKIDPTTGWASIPADAPKAVQDIIKWGNDINGLPYEYGGGHGAPLSVKMPSYDCSSSVSYMLYHAGLLGQFALVSGDFMTWGERADKEDPYNNHWVTIMANDGHVFMYVAGLRWDTHSWGAESGPNKGVGWHTGVRPIDNFLPRHPPGL